MTPVTYTNLNKLLLIRDIQDIAKTYINDDRSCRWIWKNKIADVYHKGIAFQRWLADIKGKDEDIPWKKFIQ